MLKGVDEHDEGVIFANFLNFFIIVDFIAEGALHSSIFEELVDGARADVVAAGQDQWKAHKYHPDVVYLERPNIRICRTVQTQHRDDDDIHRPNAEAL